MSRPKSLIPVDEMATRVGLLGDFSELTAERRAVMELEQTSGSSMDGTPKRLNFGAPPTAERIRSTGLLRMRRAGAIAVASLELPVWIVRWLAMVVGEMPLESRRPMSLEGVRTTGGC